MDDLSFLGNGEIDAIEELFEQYRKDPALSTPPGKNSSRDLILQFGM